jgi:1,4-dihydroxy-2-naphthoate octaprenyltransferase
MSQAHSPVEIDNPSSALAGPGLAAAVRRAFFATRPPFLIASVLPVLVGTAWASSEFHRFDGTLFGLALAATMLAHAATNVYNDVGDDVIGADSANTDRIYPYTGGSRFIQTGLLSRREMTLLALGLCVTALAIGTVLAMMRGPGIVLLGLAGLALGLLYSMPGAALSARGVGEAAVAAGLGVLPVLGAFWLQTGFVDSGAWLLCVPVSCWVAAILIVNEVPDADADRRAQKHTLVVRWGVGGARLIYGALTVLALGASGAAIVRHVLPAWYALPAVALAGLAAAAAARISAERTARPRLKQAIEMTLGIQAAGCVLIVISLIIERFH